MLIAEIYVALGKLVPLPQRGHRRPDLTNRPFRFIRVYDYLVAYAPDEEPLWVIAVMHGHRKPRVIAAIRRGRQSSITQGTGTLRHECRALLLTDFSVGRTAAC